MAERCPDRLRVEVVYALPQWQDLVRLELPAGSRAGEAVAASGILQRHPEIDAQRPDLGIWGRPCGPDRVLQDGDRVEIYRPLRVDPKARRRRRAGAQG